MYVFGGYVNGGKSNDLWKFDFKNNIWHLFDEGDYEQSGLSAPSRSSIRPCPRIGATIIYYQNAIYLFGGHDEDNEKLEDFWKFDLKSCAWVEIQIDGFKPTGRNGHTTVVINNKLVMFGGILEVTKESDEVFIYDFPSNTWRVYEALNFDGGKSPNNIKDTDSLNDDKLSVYGGKGKKMKHNSSMPHLHSQTTDLHRSTSKFQNNHTLNASQLQDTLVQPSAKKPQAASLTRRQTMNAQDQ